MAITGFGVTELNLIGASGTPKIESPNNLNLDAVNVAISTNATVGGTLTIAGNVDIADTIYHTGDSNTKIRFPVNDTITFHTGGNEQFRIDSVGNVGVGSDTPTAKLDVSGDLKISGITTTAAVSWGGHMLPTSNAAYDIGSAELKVRHLFLSDNSLKFVDSSDTEHPLSLDSGKLKFGGGLLLGNTIKADSASGILTATSFSGGGGDITGVTAEPQITWTLVAATNTAYTFSSGSGFPVAMANPTLTLIRGQTYKFDNQTSGHPFRIQSTTAQAGGGNAYNNGVTNQDATGGTGTNVLTFVVPMNAPDTLYYQCTAHPAMTGTINVLTQGSGTGLDSRTTVTGTTASIANNGSDNISITAHKSYSLLKIKPSIAAWVVLYVDAASRTADASRTQGADPAPDAGVIAEVVTTSTNQEIKMSPGVIGWHQDGSGNAVDTVFCKVVNKSGSTSTCTVSLTVVQLEA